MNHQSTGEKRFGLGVVPKEFTNRVRPADETKKEKDTAEGKPDCRAQVGITEDSPIVLTGLDKQSLI